MACEEYVRRNFDDSSLVLIGQANMIIEDYQREGYRLTLRQLYYRFVAQGWLSNTPKSYNRLGRIVNDARLAGMIDWDAIEDRTRELHLMPHWTSPAHAIQSIAHYYLEELWQDQPTRVEVWIEKEALAGVFQRICDELQVPLFACRGYASQSSIYEAAQRYMRYTDAGQTITILHFGDHDPSGIDMTRDITDRLNDVFCVEVEVDRWALNIDQVRKYDPPPNPAKLTDSRVGGYMRRFGTSSWELDALPPEVLSRLVRDGVSELRDDAAWSLSLASQERSRELLALAARKWDRIRERVLEKKKKQ